MEYEYAYVYLYKYSGTQSYCTRSTTISSTSVLYITGRAQVQYSVQSEGNAYIMNSTVPYVAVCILVCPVQYSVKLYHQQIGAKACEHSIITEVVHAIFSAGGKKKDRNQENGNFEPKDNIPYPEPHRLVSNLRPEIVLPELS